MNRPNPFPFLALIALGIGLVYLGATRVAPRLAELQKGAVIDLIDSGPGFEKYLIDDEAVLDREEAEFDNYLDTGVDPRAFDLPIGERTTVDYGIVKAYLDEKSAMTEVMSRAEFEALIPTPSHGHITPSDCAPIVEECSCGIQRWPVTDPDPADQRQLELYGQPKFLAIWVNVDMTQPAELPTVNSDVDLAWCEVMTGGDNVFCGFADPPRDGEGQPRP